MSSKININGEYTTKSELANCIASLSRCPLGDHVIEFKYWYFDNEINRPLQGSIYIRYGKNSNLKVTITYKTRTDIKVTSFETEEIADFIFDYVRMNFRQIPRQERRELYSNKDK